MSLQKHINSRYQSQKPFVVYHKPHDKSVKMISPDSESLQSIQDFDDTGFLFAPFNMKSESIFFPISDAEFETFPVKEIDLESVEFNKDDFEISNADQEKYQKLVEDCVNQIQDKKFIKAVLSRYISMNYEMKDLGQIFLRLLKKYPDAMTYIWYHPKVGLWLGASPEILANLKRNKLETMALAGTRSVKDSKDWTDKEIDEQQIVVDEIINSLKHNTSDILVSERETVQAGDLLHLRTDVATFIDRTKFNDILQSLHPTPAVCGLPKDSAYYYLLNNEGYNRQFYTGYFGEINMKNEIKRSERARNQENQAYATILASTELFVNLRCMSFQDNEIKIYVGGGITKDSQAEAEWEETVHKSQTMLKVL